MDNGKSLLTSLCQREKLPLFDKEGPGEIFNDRHGQFWRLHKKPVLRRKPHSRKYIFDGPLKVV
jgi:hypothetical protein